MTTIKRFLTLFLIATVSIAAWGADVTYRFADDPDNPGNATEWTSGDIDTYTSWTATSGTNDPAYYTSGTGLRVYNGGSFSISSSKTIASITLTFSGNGYTFSASNTTNPQTVTPDATSYNWDVSRTCRLQQIEITYSGGGGTTYTVTLNKNGSTSDITGCSGTYTLPTTGEHVANACEGWAWHCWTNAAYSTSSPTTTAPSSTVITSMSSAGTAYAVYKHEEAGGGSSTVTFTKADFSGSGTISASKSGVTVSCVGNIPTAGYVTFTENNTLTISSSSGNITAIDFTCSGADYTGNMTDVSDISTSSWNISVDNPGVKTTVRVSSIVVTIGGGGTTTYTSSPDCTPCDYKVTLTKGEESHGTFTLDKSNGEYNNCTSNFVVTVSGITPASGYYCTGVTATGDHNSVSGPDGSGNYTVTYEMGNAITSTITANFAPNPKYTVTWNMNGDESNTAEYEEGESIVFPGTATGCDGKVFRGWSETTVSETDVEPSYVTSVTMPAHDVTYYAVYAEENGSGGTPSSESYSFTTLSWNATGGNWTSGKNGAGYLNSGVQVTTGASGANATCPNSYSNITSIVVSYCTNGSSGAGSITMEVNGTSLTNTITKTGGTTARNTTFDFSSTTPTGSPRITVTCTTNSIYVCGVTINYGGGTTYTGYTTTCGPGISAQNVGWITSSVGQKVKRVINVSAKNFDEATTLAATCMNSNFAVTLGETAVPAGAAGLTTTLTVEYMPTAQGREENVEIELTAGDKSRTITVNGRCVPDEFLIITKKASTWYALPANMSGGPGEYAGIEVNPNNTTTPTVVPSSPSTTIYSMASVADSRYADNGNCVRLVGLGGMCLWSNMAEGATKVNIQNKTSVATAATDNHDWLLTTTDGIHYTIANPHHPQYGDGRRLAYGTKFGMYVEDTEFFIVSAGCTSQPDNVLVSPHRVDATFSWMCTAPSITIDVYTNEAMTEGHLSATATSAPYMFTGLEETTDYWYKLTPGTDTDCAVTGSFKTTGPSIDIVEWQQEAVVLHIDKGDIDPVIVIDGQEEHGSITGGGGTATELFFAKYFEGAGSMKLVSIFNGTTDDISLTNYSIFVKMRGSSAWAPTNDVTLDLSSLGSIKAGQEIIFFSRPLATETALDGCSESFLDGKVATSSSADSNPRWVECDGGTFKRINFNGNDPILLRKSGTTIDVIGSENGAAPTATNCLSGDNEKGWGGTVRNMDKGKSPSDPAFDAFYEASSKSPATTTDSINILSGFGINLTDDEISLTTARCIFFRDKRVTSGDSAVLMNGSTFVTFTNHDTFKSEWYGRSVCMNTAAKTAAGVSDDAQATCNSYQDIANMDYNEYYIDYTSHIEEGKTLDQFISDPETKEYTISIPNLVNYTCLNIRFQLRHNGEVITEVAQQVPIMVSGSKTTSDALFSALVVDQSTHLPSYSHSVERCKTCDVVILGTGTLIKAADSEGTDVPEVGNVKVYPGGKLVVPSTTNYTVKSLAFRRQEDEVSTANIEGKLNISTDDAVYLDMRIDPTNWHYFTLPYDCKVADIRFANPYETAIPTLGTDFLLKWYNGEKRAETQSGGCWEMVAPDATLKKGIGYIFALPGEGKERQEFRFPMSNTVISEEKADHKDAMGIYAYGGDKSMTEVRANHRGWNLIGNPYLLPYTSDITNPVMTGLIVEDHSEDNPLWNGHYTFDPAPATQLRYIVEPIDNGWTGYEQVALTDYSMKPFTSYFIQVGGVDPNDPQGVRFNLSRVNRSSIVARHPAEYEEKEDTHPVWCAITLTNDKGEKDETTLLISNDFTDEYDIMDDLVKMRGTYYQYAQITTRPVLASRNNEGEMAFNALPDSSAIAGIPLNYFAAFQGEYIFAYDNKYDRDGEVKEVKLLDTQTNTWYDLMSENYVFTSNREDNTTRFILSVRVERKTPHIATDLDLTNTQDDRPRKILINNHVYIQRGGAIYDITGKQMLNH